jgi:hypothetical protein
MRHELIRAAVRLTGITIVKVVIICMWLGIWLGMSILTTLAVECMDERGNFAWFYALPHDEQIAAIVLVSVGSYLRMYVVGARDATKNGAAQ